MTETEGECIRLGTPLSLEGAQRLVEGYVEHYNNVRLDSAHTCSIADPGFDAG